MPEKLEKLNPTNLILGVTAIAAGVVLAVTVDLDPDAVWGAIVGLLGGAGLKGNNS